MVHVCCSISEDDNDFCKLNGLSKSTLLRAKIAEMRVKLAVPQEIKEMEAV